LAIYEFFHGPFARRNQRDLRFALDAQRSSRSRPWLFSRYPSQFDPSKFRSFAHGPEAVPHGHKKTWRRRRHPRWAASASREHLTPRRRYRRVSVTTHNANVAAENSRFDLREPWVRRMYRMQHRSIPRTFQESQDRPRRPPRAFSLTAWNTAYVPPYPASQRRYWKKFRLPSLHRRSQPPPDV
jgi:hypothetical protein